MPAQVEGEHLGAARQRIDLRLPILPGRTQPVQQQDRLAAALADIGATATVQLNKLHDEHLVNINFQALLQLPSWTTAGIRKHI